MVVVVLVVVGVVVVVEVAVVVVVVRALVVVVRAGWSEPELHADAPQTRSAKATRRLIGAAAT